MIKKVREEGVVHGVWAAAGGEEPEAFVLRTAGRCPLVC